MKTVFYLMLPLFILTCFASSCEKEQGPVSGKITNYSDCKGLKSLSADLAQSDVSQSDTLSCIDYIFEAAESKLLLKHINAGFNCCPQKLYCETSLLGDTIIVKESEKSALCDCNCLYDLDIELLGVLPRTYFIKIIEPYAGDEEKLYFSVSLDQNSQGSYCVTRKRYPWGMSQYQ